MSAALRLVELSMSPSPLSSIRPSLRPTLGASMRPSMRFSMRPTLVPSSRATVLPLHGGSSMTEPPSTQRSATMHPQLATAARLEAKSLVTIMRLNVDFLASLVDGNGAPLAIGALEDIHESLDRLEHRFSATHR